MPYNISDKEPYKVSDEEISDYFSTFFAKLRSEYEEMRVTRGDSWIVSSAYYLKAKSLQEIGEVLELYANTEPLEYVKQEVRDKLSEELIDVAELVFMLWSRLKAFQDFRRRD